MVHAGGQHDHDGRADHPDRHGREGLRFAIREGGPRTVGAGRRHQDPQVGGAMAQRIGPGGARPGRRQCRRRHRRTRARVSGPIPLPVKTERWTYAAASGQEEPRAVRAAHTSGSWTSMTPPADDGRADQARPSGGSGTSSGRRIAMTTGLIGRKLGMTRLAEDGTAVPVTVIEAGPCRAWCRCARACQLGFERKRFHPGRSWDTLRRPGSRRRAGAAGLRAQRRGPGAEVKVDIFAPGTASWSPAPPRVAVRAWCTGTFGGGPAAHGNTRHRKPGSISPGHRPVTGHQGQANAGPHGRGPPHGARSHSPGGRGAQSVVRPRRATAGARNGIVTVAKQEDPGRVGLRRLTTRPPGPSAQHLPCRILRRHGQRAGVHQAVKVYLNNQRRAPRHGQEERRQAQGRQAGPESPKKKGSK